MTRLALYPLWFVDVAGSLAMLILAVLCLHRVLVLYRRDPEDALNMYLLWLVAAIFSFSIFRSVGHLVGHLLVWTGHGAIRTRLAPLTGGLNSITFIVIFAVTLFFRNVLILVNRMAGDRHNIETISRQLLILNRDVEEMISDRTRTEMALNLAHEIRNPVMIIGGLFRRMCGSLAARDKEAARYKKKIDQQLERLNSLVAGLEEIKAASRVHFTTIELNRMLGEVVEIVRPEAQKKGIELNFAPASGPLPFLGNKQYLRVALLHLLRNSIEACGRGDRIDVQVMQDAAGVVVLIRDTGPGIPRYVLEHIFEPFYSTRDGSTGLGLPYVRQIIREHRGDIDITSTRGEGVKVELHLPTHLGELQQGPQGI